jgi:hypothetical protein
MTYLLPVLECDDELLECDELELCDELEWELLE